jgi:hypothetical protein
MSAPDEKQVLAGLVERVTFHNEENGFCVLRVKVRGQKDLITVLGHAASISAGEWVTASGSWQNDRTHGLQFRAQIKLETIASGVTPTLEVIADRPTTNDKITRVCGPFTVEATIQTALTLAEEKEQAAGASKAITNPRAYLDRMIEVLRQSKTLRLPGNMSLELETVRPLADREHLHAEATAKNGSEKRIAIVFGPEDGAIGSEYVFNASMEAMQQGFRQLFLFGFAIDANVALRSAGKRSDGSALYQVAVRGRTLQNA